MIAVTVPRVQPEHRIIAVTFTECVMPSVSVNETRHMPTLHTPYSIGEHKAKIKPRRRAMVMLRDPHESAMIVLPPPIMIVVPEIPVVIPIPIVVVLPPTGVAVPIPGEVSASFVSRRGPAGSRVRRAGPVTGVPLVMVPQGRPIALDPSKFRAGARRQNRDNTWRRRCANLYFNGNLGERGYRGKDQ